MTLKTSGLRLLSAAAALALLLTGCADGGKEPDPNAPDAPLFTLVEYGKAKPPTGAKTKLVGPDGKPMYVSELSNIVSNKGEDAEYSDADFGFAIVKGSAYLSPPSGICLTSRDDPGSFDEDELTFKGVDTEEMIKDYIRVRTNDQINGLRVITASAFFRDEGRPFADGAAGSFFMGSECTLIGELEIVGYARAAEEDNYSVQAGDIIFVPSGRCRLPVMSYSYDKENGLYRRFYTGMDKGLVWVNEYGSILLGNIYDTAADVSCLPDDGEFVKVKATVKNIKITSSLDWIDIIQADILTIERI